MRFGRNLHRYHVVEWAPFYIDYQVLKQRYKAAQRLAVDQDKAPDLTDFRAFLHQELSKARSFYERKHGTLQQSVKTLFELHPIDRDLDLHLPSALEVEDLQATIVEWRDSFKQLLWFWVVNFDKTISSLAKFETHLAASTNDLALRTRSIDELCRLENTLNTLSKFKRQIDAGPPTQVTSTLPKQPTETLLSQLPSKGELAVIERDDDFGLELHLEERPGGFKTDRNSFEEYLFSLLYFSIMTASNASVQVLLRAIGFLPRFGDHVHRLISRLGRTRRLQDQNTPIQNPGE
ncbi:MAG: hypothetical protein L6R35_006106 [Caloplaca aegaea]|nr:MAG: hypothetical protein L6R35_006106 [Caloplaca aegaea]